jgi:hypothetical protein
MAYELPLQLKWTQSHISQTGLRKPANLLIQEEGNKNTQTAKNINTFLGQNHTATISVHIIQSLIEFHNPQICAHFVDIPLPYMVRMASLWTPTVLQMGHTHHFTLPLLF